MKHAERPGQHRWSRHEYGQLIDHGLLDEDDPIELLDGLLLVKEPQHSPHRTAVLLTAKTLERGFGEGWFVQTQSPIILDDRSEPEPDVCVVRGSPRDYAAAHPTHPALIVEVAQSGPADAPVRADGRSHRPHEAGQHAQHRDADLSHPARAFHRLALDGLRQDGAEGVGRAGDDRRRQPLARHDEDHSSPLHARLPFRRHLRLHAVTERVPLHAPLSQQIERAHRADRRRGGADPRGRFLLGPADGQRAPELHLRRPHLLVPRGVLRRGPHGRRREGVGPYIATFFLTTR